MVRWRLVYSTSSGVPITEAFHGSSPLIQIIPAVLPGSHRALSQTKRFQAGIQPLINLFTWFASDAFSSGFRPLQTKPPFFYPLARSLSRMSCSPLVSRCPFRSACANRRYQPFDMFCLASISCSTWLLQRAECHGPRNTGACTGSHF